jgi:hypothetical protein
MLSRDAIKAQKPPESPEARAIRQERTVNRAEKMLRRVLREQSHAGHNIPDFDLASNAHDYFQRQFHFKSIEENLLSAITQVRVQITD